MLTFFTMNQKAKHWVTSTPKTSKLVSASRVSPKQIIDWVRKKGFLIYLSLSRMSAHFFYSAVFSRKRLSHYSSAVKVDNSKKLLIGCVSNERWSLAQFSESALDQPDSRIVFGIRNYSKCVVFLHLGRVLRNLASTRDVTHHTGYVRLLLDAKQRTRSNGCCSATFVALVTQYLC